MRLDLFCASLEDPKVVYALLRLTAEPQVSMVGGPGGTPYREGPLASVTRRPVNLVLVLDRSSSMRGPRLGQAVLAGWPRARAVLAVGRVLERLDDRARLGVVTFDAAARVLLPPGPVTDEARRRLNVELEKLDTGAGTNLAAGWRKGCELAAAGYVREAIARV